MVDHINTINNTKILNCGKPQAALFLKIVKVNCSYAGQAIHLLDGYVSLVIT